MHKAFAIGALVLLIFTPIDGIAKRGGGGQDKTTLGNLGCASDEIPRFDGDLNEWVCDDSFTVKRVFLTRDTFNANMGGIEGPNDECNEAANTAGHFGKFKAWAAGGAVGLRVQSPVNQFARSRFQYLLFDGTKIADDWFDLIDCTEGVSGNECLDAPIDVDEFGSKIADPTIRVWTNVTTEGDGDFAPAGGSCDEWTFDGAVVDGAIGFAKDDTDPAVNGTNATWTITRPRILCSEFAHLYCFEQ